MNVLGVIMARAGSAGLANKHLRPLLGRAVVEYTLDHALSARSLSRVVVSTDCAGVKRLAREWGLEVIDRPAELATAEASVQDVLLHAVGVVEGSGIGVQGSGRGSVEGKGGGDVPSPSPSLRGRGVAFGVAGVVVLYGNVPVRGEEVIDRAVEMLRRTGCDSVRSFCPVGKWHPSWMSVLEGDRVVGYEERERQGDKGTTRQGDHSGREASPSPIPCVRGRGWGRSIHRRQDLAPVYLHDGAVVAVSRASLMRGREFPKDPHVFFGVDRRGILTEMGETVEIDHLRDLYWAEAVLRERAERRKPNEVQRACSAA
jgi:CMP-N,N'-diacetyllegionaminic acid synthase